MNVIKQLNLLTETATALANAADTDSIKLKDAMAEFMPEVRLAVDAFGKPHRTDLDAAMAPLEKARTRAACIKACDAMAELAADLLEGEKAALAEKEADKAKSLSLKQLTNKIRQRLTRMQEDARQIGHWLLVGKDHFETNGDWLRWAEEEFDIRKAHCYRLVKVAKHFGADESFDGTSAHALRILIEGNTDEEAMLAAQEKAKSGDLTPGAARDIVKESKGRQSDSNASSEEQGEGGTKAQGGARSARDSETDRLLEDNRRLLKDNADMRSELAQMREALERQTAVIEGKDTMPTLPQFYSDSMAVRLGLTEEQAADVKQARAAFRALSKYWNEETNAESYNLLVEAVDAIRFPVEKQAATQLNAH